MSHYRRRIRRLSAAMIAMALLIRIVTATGLDGLAGQAVARALSAPSIAGFLFYLELGQAVSPPDAAVSMEAPDAAAEPAEPDASEEPAESDGPEIPAEDPDTSGALGSVQTPAADDSADETAAPAAEDPATEPDPAPSAGSEAAPEPLVFTQADADAVTIGGACTYSVDKLALLQQPSVLDFDQDGPTVLIVHTHTSEAYTQEAGWEYEGDATARTQDPDFSVVRVGRELAETLESHGISVLHDESFNDYPSYNGAYDRTLEKIEAWVAQYPSIQMVIDVHRDAAANADGTPVRQAVTLDGEETARLMLVMGTDQGGLSHPDWQTNLSWALKLQAVLERQYPGICRDLDLRTERFNQHMTPGSMLVEVGSSGNTLREALAAARDLGEALSTLIAGT